MSDIDLSTCTIEEISQMILITPANQFNSIIPFLTPDQVAAAITTLEKSRDNNWREKIVAIIQELTETKHLEAAGRSLSLPQALHLLDESNKNDHNGHWKLSPPFGWNAAHLVYTNAPFSFHPANERVETRSDHRTGPTSLDRLDS